jgi:hypothetical protein
MPEYIHRLVKTKEETERTKQWKPLAFKLKTILE